MAKVLSVALALAMVAVALGCGNDSQSSSTTTAASGGNGRSTGTEAKACVQPTSTDRSACHDSYDACAQEAKEKVQAFVAGDSPPLDIVAAERAKGIYDASSEVQAGTAGCLAALLDEYNNSHRDSGTPTP